MKSKALADKVDSMEISTVRIKWKRCFMMGNMVLEGCKSTKKNGNAKEKPPNY